MPMNPKQKFGIFLSFLIISFAPFLLAENLSQPTVEIQLSGMPYENQGMLQFDIVVENPTEEDVSIQVLEGKAPYDFQLGETPSWRERELSYTASSSIVIQKESKRIIGSFDQII